VTPNAGGQPQQPRLSNTASQEKFALAAEVESLVGLPDALVTQGLAPGCPWHFRCSTPDAAGDSGPCVADASCFQDGLSSFKCSCASPPCVRDDYYSGTYSVYSRRTPEGNGEGWFSNLAGGFDTYVTSVHHDGGINSSARLVTEKALLEEKGNALLKNTIKIGSQHAHSKLQQIGTEWVHGILLMVKSFQGTKVWEAYGQQKGPQEKC
jgi:hypothetical protein